MLNLTAVYALAPGETFRGAREERAILGVGGARRSESYIVADGRIRHRLAGFPFALHPPMRTPLLLAIAAVFTIGAVACVAEDGSSLNGRRTLRRTEAASEEHDEDDVEGENDVDTGNPNATRTPTAPTSAGTAAAEFDLALSTQTPTLGLGDETEVTATITPKNGFTGPVQLAVTGLPAGVTAAPATATITSGPATAKLTLKSDLTPSVTAAGSSIPLVVKATAGSAEATANANFAVAPKVTVTIPMNVDALRGAASLRAEYGGPAFAGNGSLKTQPGNGIVISVFNADSKSHIIHGPGGKFPHGNTGAPIQPNSFEGRTRTLGVGDEATAYLHDGQNGQGASFKIKVTAAE